MDDVGLAGLGVDALLRFARVLTGDRQLAEDLVQDVLEQLLRRPGGLGHIDDLDRYARRMVVNGYVSWRRKWSRLLPTDRLPDAAVPPAPLEAVDLRAELRVALARLTRKQRAAVVLRYYLDLADNQVADEMGCSVTTARSHISRGLAAMRIDLSEVARATEATP